MTGIFDGIGALITFSLILLAYVPFIVVALLMEIGLLNAVKAKFKVVPIILAYFFLSALTLLTMRSAPYVAVDWLLIFAVIATLVYLIFKIMKKRSA